MQYSVVKYSEAFEQKRIDAEYYLPEFLELEKQISSKPFFILREVSGFIKKGIFDISPERYKKSGIPLIRTFDIKSPLINTSNSVFIDSETQAEFIKTQLKSGDLVLTKIGAYIGDVSLLTDDHEYYNFSQNVVGVKINDSFEYRGYLLAFLLSHYGKNQILRKQMLSGQGKLELEDIRNLKIPKLEDKFISLVNKLIHQSYEIANSSKSLYSEAENLLLEELGLKDWKPKHQLSYIKNYSDTQKAERFDAEYFQPQYDEIIEKVKNIQNDDLGNIVKWSKGIEVGSEQYIDEGSDFIRISDFNTKGISEASKKISHDLFAELKDKFSPKKGDILFTKDGTIGLTYLVNQDQEAIISGAFLKLRPKIDIESEYLALVLNSIICKKQIEMMSGGAIIAHLKPSDAMKLQIPILSSKEQKEISSKIIDSKEKDNQSKSLLEIAKIAVEMAIETNEEKASKWIDQELEKLGVQLSSQ